MSEVKLRVKIPVLTLPFTPNQNLEHVTQHPKFPTYKRSVLLPALPTSQDFNFKNIGVNMFHKFKKGLTSLVDILLSHCASYLAFFGLSITARAQIGQAQPCN